MVLIIYSRKGKKNPIYQASYYVSANVLNTSGFHLLLAKMLLWEGIWAEHLQEEKNKCHQMKLLPKITQLGVEQEIWTRFISFQSPLSFTRLCWTNSDHSILVWLFKQAYRVLGEPGGNAVVVAQSSVGSTLCDLIDCSMPGFPVPHYLLVFAQTHVHWASDAICVVHCLPFLLLPSIFPSIMFFSDELALHIRWPKYWSFSFSISPSSEYSGLG